MASRRSSISITCGDRMPSTAEDYVSARSKVDAFRRGFDETAKILDQVATALHDLPERFAFINLREPKLPSTAFGATEVDALKFQSPTEIQTMLAEFHKAHKLHVELYLALPPELRSSVAAPLAREFAKL